MHPSTDDVRLEQLVTTMTARMTRITRPLGTWAQDAPRDLQAIEQHVMRIIKEVGATLVAGLCTLVAPAAPPPAVACPCGHRTRYHRQRPATVTTILGPITVPRPYYHCAACGQGQHPLDAQLEFSAGSRSAGLDELLALLGATQDSFADAAAVLERLTLVHLSPNTVRDATEQLGAVLVAHQTERATRGSGGRPPHAGCGQPRATLYHHGWRAGPPARTRLERTQGGCLLSDAEPPDATTPGAGGDSCPQSQLCDRPGRGRDVRRHCQLL